MATVCTSSLLIQDGHPPLSPPLLLSSSLLVVLLLVGGGGETRGGAPADDVGLGGGREEGVVPSSVDPDLFPATGLMYMCICTSTSASL